MSLKNLSIEELLEILRTALRPQGTLQVVKLELGNYGYMNHDFVSKAIDQLEIMMLTRQEATPLEKLGIYLLLDSIGYER